MSTDLVLDIILYVGDSFGPNNLLFRASRISRICMKSYNFQGDFLGPNFICFTFFTSTQEESVQPKIYLPPYSSSPPFDILLLGPTTTNSYLTFSFIHFTCCVTSCHLVRSLKGYNIVTS